MIDLLHILRLLRRATLVRAWLEGATGVAAVLTVGVALGAFGIAVGVPATAARIVLALAMLGAVVAAVLHVVRRARRFGDERATAAYLEANDPELRTDLRTALDYASRADAGEDDATRELRALLVARVGRLVRDREERLLALLPARPIQPVVTASLAAACALALAFVVQPGPVGAALRALAAGPPPADAAAPAGSFPVVAAVDVTVQAPAYTGRPPERVPFSSGDIAALAGSQIRLRATTTRPVTAASLRVEAGGEVERYGVELEDPYVLAVGFPLTASGSYRFEVELQGDGSTVSDPIERRLRALPDRTPEVRLLEPAADLEVTPDQVVNLEYVASDDFGLQDVSLVWAFAGDEDDTRSLALQTGLVVPSHREHVPFDLQPLLLMPRDEVLVWVEATDNNAVAGPQTGRSRTVRLRVASPEDRSAEVLQLKEQLFEGLLLQLARSLTAAVVDAELDGERIALVPADAAPAERNPRAQALRELQPEWMPLLQTWERLLALMADDPATADADRQLLGASYEQLYDAVRDQSAVVDALGVTLPADGLPLSRFNTLARVHAPTVDQTERAVLMLEDLIALHKADDVQRALEELAAIRERLAELLEQYRDTEDPALREQIERELRRLEQRMRELMQRLAAQMQNLPTEHLNADAIDRSDVAENLENMGGALDDVRRMLDQGDIEGAIEAMMQLDTTLDALQQELGDPLANASPDSANQFDREMAELMDQVNDLEAQEAALQEETEALRAEMQERRDAEVRDQLQEALARLQERAEELREDYGGLANDEVGADSQRAMQAVEQGLEVLEQQLAMEDLAGAESAAERVASQLSDASFELRMDSALLQRSGDGREQAERARRATDDTTDAVRAMQDRLGELMQMSQPVPTPGDRGRMQQLGQRQGQIRQQLDQLGQRVQQIGQRNPTVPDQLGAPMQQVGENMEQAQRSLERGQPRPSLQGQQSALQGLRQMRQQMQQMTQQQRQQQRQGQQGRSSTDRVPVPEEGASDRRAYRDRVVDAMREGGLEAYDDEIREYYETLLR